MKKVKVIAIAFAFTFIIVAFATQPVAAASRYETLSSYMTDNYDTVEGGYMLPSDGVTRINPTYGAVSIINEMELLDDRPPPITVTSILEFCVNHQWLTGNPDDEASYGGFSDYLLATVNMATNYHGLLLWQLLKAQNDIPNVGDYDINATANAFWINKTADSGGFATKQGESPDIISTYYALASFRIIDGIYGINAWDTYVNETATTEWIESCRVGDSYLLSPNSDLTSVTATAAAVLAYHAIDPLTLVPGASNVQTWLVNRQVLNFEVTEFEGGFEEGVNTDDPNLVSTYFALSALNALNAVPSVNSTAVKSFILNCQSEDGSWAQIPGMSTGSLLNSAYACQLLNIINPRSALSVLSSSVDPYSEGSGAIDWRVLVVVGLIGGGFIIALYALRMD
ncbi:MAG: prenyltransferase/squalene oxidase repeat-containing protein [Promethearchaeota archaeon]